MPVAADLSRCIPFTSAFCHRMALYKQVALFNLSGLTSSRYRLSLPGNCDDARKREISFLSENIVSIVVLLLHLILFTIRRLHRITLASLFLIRTDCLFDALVSPFGIVSFMPWNSRFHALKLSVSRYETKWYHPMVSDFIHDFTLLSTLFPA